MEILLCKADERWPMVEPHTAARRWGLRMVRPTENGETYRGWGDLRRMVRPMGDGETFGGW